MSQNEQKNQPAGDPAPTRAIRFNSWEDVTFSFGYRPGKVWNGSGSFEGKIIQHEPSVRILVGDQDVYNLEPAQFIEQMEGFIRYLKTLHPYKGE